MNFSYVVSEDFGWASSQALPLFPCGTKKKKKSMHYCYTKKYIIRVCNLLLLFRSDVYMYTVYIYKSQNNHLEKIKWKNGDWNDSNDYFYALSKQFEKKKKDNLFSSIDHWPSIEENKWFSMFIEYFSRSRIIASYLIDAGSYTFELKISHQIIIILLLKKKIELFQLIVFSWPMLRHESFNEWKIRLLHVKAAFFIGAI